MQVIRTIQEMTEWVDANRDRERSIALVPTQGCLHQGHESLLHSAKREEFGEAAVVMSLFVNPLQFRKPAYEAYPRREEQDIELARNAGVDAVFAPGVFEVYPSAPDLDWIFDLQHGASGPRNKEQFTIDQPIKSPGFEYVRVPQSLTHRMDGIDFPWHFDGVATVVRNLFKIIKPNTSYFGQKDIQQLAILRSMNHWMGSPTKIVPVPVMRDHDGLSSSSRLVMLNQAQRSIACLVAELLNVTWGQIQAREIPIAKALQSFLDTCKNIDTGSDKLEIDSLVYADLSTLDHLEEFSSNGVLYLAYLLNGIRLAETLSVQGN